MEWLQARATTESGLGQQLHHSQIQQLWSLYLLPIPCILIGLELPPAIMASNNLAGTHQNGTAGAAPVNGRASHHNGATERLQIVDDEKHFTYASPHSPTRISNTFFRRPDLTKQIERWGLRDTGFEYNIVAVFGSQSTGKSELLKVLLKRVLAESSPRYSTE